MLTFNQNIGRFDRRIILLSPLETRDAGGGVVTSWVNVGTFWAQFLPQTGREIQQAAQKLSLAAATFRLRYRQVAATWRVMLGEAIYELVAPPVEIGRREYLDLVCQALDRTDLTIDGVGVQALTVDLAVADESKAITYATAFASSPAGVYAQVISPSGGYVISCTIVQASRATTGFTVTLGAAIPATGYKLSIIAVL
jgi:SPP1 family predicted phage head-tail adaptor